MYLLDACVFSCVGVYLKIFKHRRRRDQGPFQGISKNNGFFGGWCEPFEFH
jgi:hypothetical protein